MQENLKTTDLPSVVNFKKSTERTKRLIHSIIGNIVATEAVLYHFSKSNKKIYKDPIAKSLKLEKKDKAYIYELGFVALFANFESFSHQIIKDLLRKYPESLTKSEKTVSVAEVFSLKTAKHIREYIIDQTAIENSTSIESWSNYLESRFNIKVTPNTKMLEQLCVLNELRNILLHSGGITNTLFIRKMARYFKSTHIPLNQKIDFIDREKYFETLSSLLTKMHTYISQQ